MKIGPYHLTIQKKSQRVREFGSGVAGGMSIQHIGDLLLQLEAYQSDSNNKYLTKESQVAETLFKYRGQAAKGNVLLRNILETRSAFTAGRGLSTNWEGDAEREFIKQFFKVNKIKLSFLRQLARERGFEGQVLLVLQPHADRIPRVRFLSWYDTRYEVETEASDYTAIQRVAFHNGQSIAADRIAFMKFNTRMNSTIGTPLFAGCLHLLENIEDAIQLLKSVNKTAANPTPFFKFEIEEDAQRFNEWITKTGWKMGQPVATNGAMSLVQIGYGPFESLTEEVVTLAKLISGHTSVPPHYFGFAELVSNRATADDMGAAFVEIAETETEEWGSGFTDLIGRAMALHNVWAGSDLNHQGGEALIEVISETEFKRIAAIWLPLWLGGAITTETFLSKIPTINEKEETPKVMDELMQRGVDIGIGQQVTPGEVVPPERKIALDAMKTYGNTRGD